MFPVLLKKPCFGAYSIKKSYTFYLNLNKPCFGAYLKKKNRTVSTSTSPPLELIRPTFRTHFIFEIFLVLNKPFQGPWFGTYSIKKFEQTFRKPEQAVQRKRLTICHQWRIQDFPNGGGAVLSQMGGAHILFSGKKCMKLKEIGLKLSGYHADTPITIKAEPSIWPTAAFINIHEHPI